MASAPTTPTSHNSFTASHPQRKVNNFLVRPNNLEEHFSPERGAAPGRRKASADSHPQVYTAGKHQPSNKTTNQEILKAKFGHAKNVVTKFAFATRAGYVPNNPYKTNQDAFILAPNIM